MAFFDDFVSSNDLDKHSLDLKLLDMERSRISDELHDTVVQNLTALVHKGELCNRLFDRDPVRARIELSEMSNVLSDTIRELRDIIYNLRPPSVSDFGLKQGIEDFCENINKVHSIAFKVKCIGEAYDLPEDVENNIFRIAQEACTNIIKHSKATKTDIVLEYKPDGLYFSVTDNGIGISDKVTEVRDIGRKNFGLSIMKERANIINGSFRIESSEKGTCIRVFVPNTLNK